MAVMTIEGKVLGQRRNIFTDLAIPLPPTPKPGGRPLTLRDLIMHVVDQEVVAFKERQEKRKLDRFMSRDEIAEGVAKGKIDAAGRDVEQAVDVNVAIDTALQAFEDGLYYVFVDDHQYTSLDSEVPLKADSHMLFVRLVALAGG